MKTDCLFYLYDSRRQLHVWFIKIVGNCEVCLKAWIIYSHIITFAYINQETVKAQEKPGKRFETVHPFFYKKNHDERNLVHFLLYHFHQTYCNRSLIDFSSLNINFSLTRIWQVPTKALRLSMPVAGFSGDQEKLC